MNFSDFLPTTWVQAHAAITHFPIALLLVAVFFEAGALLLRRTRWRNEVWGEIAFATLTLSVLSMPFALLTGYFTGSGMPRPPAGFDPHWKAAVATALLSAAWWVWKWKARSKTTLSTATIAEFDASDSGVSEIETRRVLVQPRRQNLTAQWAMLALAGFCAMGVGYTGHLGGEMTFGGRSDYEPVAEATPASEDPNRMEKIALAAGKMENAAGKLDVATDRLAIASQKSAPAAPVAVAPAPIVNVAPGEVKVDASALDRAAANMERVASRFETTAQKMESIAQQMNAKSSSPTQVAAAPKPATAPTKSNAPGGKTVVIAANPGASTAKTAAPTTVATTAAPAAPQFDAQLVTLGAQKYQDEELGCTGCHKLNGKGGRSGPDLTFAGRLHSDVEWQIAHLKDPKSKIPGSSMPAYNDLPEGDLRALATYMASLR